MSLQAGVWTSKVPILLGARLTSSIVLRSGRLSEPILQLQELLEGVEEVEISPFKYDSSLLAAQVNETKSNLSQIGFDFEAMFQMVSGMEDKLELLEGKQDVVNSGLLFLCQVARGFKDAVNVKPFQEVSAKIVDHSSLTYEDKSLKGLQFLAEASESEVIEKSIII